MNKSPVSFVIVSRSPDFLSVRTTADNARVEPPLRGEPTDLEDFGVAGAEKRSILELILSLLSKRKLSKVDARDSNSVGAALAALSVAG
jgi:hypothetical protein